MSLNIRHANAKDLRKVFNLCWQGYKDLEGVCPETVEPDLLMRWIYDAWKQQPCVLLEKNKEIIGFWGLCELHPRWSRDVLLGDYMFYVMPEHRSMTATKLLTKEVKRIADEQGRAMRLNYIFDGKEEAHMRLYKRMGFSVSGIFGIYRKD